MGTWVFSGVSVNDGFNFEGVCVVSQDLGCLCFRYIKKGRQSGEKMSFDFCGSFHKLLS